MSWWTDAAVDGLQDENDSLRARIAELEAGYREIAANDRGSVDIIEFARIVGLVYRRVMPEFSLVPTESNCEESRK